MDIPTCRICGGTMRMNDRKTPDSNPKMPDFLCNQDFGTCGAKSQYRNKKGEIVDGFNPTPAWKPTEKQPFVRPANLPAGTRFVKAPNNGDGFVADKPVQQTQPVPPTATPIRVVDGDSPDWDKIGAQKGRCLMAAAVLQGKELDWKQLQSLEAWVLTGKTPNEIAGEGFDDVPPFN